MIWVILYDNKKGIYCLINKESLKIYKKMYDDYLLVKELEEGITETEASTIYHEFLDSKFLITNNI